MKKEIRNARSISNERMLYNKIMKDLKPVISKAINESAEANKDVEDSDEIEEQALNELFGIGSKSVAKPEKVFSVDNTDEENAEIIMQYCEYYLSKANDNVSKGVKMFIENCGKWIVKAPVLIVKGILAVISRTIKLTVKTPVRIASLILMGISILTKLIKSGVEKSDVALKKLYESLKGNLTAGYNKFKKDTKSTIETAGENFNVWLGIASAAVTAVCNKIEGATDAFEDWVKQVIEDAKEKIDAAVILAKTWFSSASKAVKDYLNKAGKELRNTVVDAWNKVDKSVRKAYNKIAETIEKWMIDLADLIDEIGKKIESAKDATKSFVIDKKDKMLVYNIQKSVKGLSDKFDEDQVVALVRKCYNESMKLNTNGKFVVNESYFHDRKTRKRILNEKHSKILKNKRRV